MMKEDEDDEKGRQGMIIDAESESKGKGFTLSLFCLSHIIWFLVNSKGE